MSRTTLTMLVMAALATAGGCSTAIKEGVGVATGAKGLYAPVRPVAAGDARPLGEYGAFELGTFSDDFGGNVPASLDGHFRTAFAEQLADSRLAEADGTKTLLIRGRYIHYEDASTLGFAIGPLEQVIARVELVDESSGRVLGVANVVGRTTNRVNVGVEKKAQGLAKGLIEWLKQLYPEGD